MTPPKRKWFQVTRVSALLPAGMHGMKRRSRERRAFRLSAPQPALSSPAGSMPPGTPQPFASLSPGTGCSKRPFTRPQRNPFSRVPFRGQRSWPAPSLPAPQFPSPFGSLLHYRSTVRPVPAASLRKPVAGSLLCSIRLPPASAPRQDFYFPSVQSVQPAYRGSVRLPNPPDRLSLPASVSIASFGIGSSFQARSVSEACCSSNLLEPSPLCSRMTNRSTNFASFRSVFINSFLLLFLMLSDIGACISCGKNEGGPPCLGY